MEEDLEKFGEQLKEIKEQKPVKQKKVKPIEIEIEEDLTDEQITKDLTEEEVVKQKQVQGKTYNDVIETMPELKEDLDYILLTKKLEKGKTLTKKEQDFKEVYELAKQKEQEYEKQQAKQLEEETIKQKVLQEKINKEYEEFKEINPDRVESIDTTKSLSMNGSENFLKVAKMFLKIKKSKKKGGKIFVKVARPKKVSFELLDLQFLSETPKLPTFEYINILDIDSVFLNKIFADASINPNYTLNFKCNKATKTLDIINSGKYKFTNTIQLDKIIEDIDIVFGAPFYNSIMNLNAPLQISLKKDTPVMIYEKTDDSVITIIIAPLIENEDDK